VIHAVAVDFHPVLRVLGDLHPNQAAPVEVPRAAIAIHLLLKFTLPLQGAAIHQFAAHLCGQFEMLSRSLLAVILEEIKLHMITVGKPRQYAVPIPLCAAFSSPPITSLTACTRSPA